MIDKNRDIQLLDRKERHMSTFSCFIHISSLHIIIQLSCFTINVIQKAQ